jgi:aminoglycoside phosphotransferase (APT) family kinase protein
LAGTGRLVRLGEDRVRALLRLQHPDLAGQPLRMIPGGGLSWIWRLGDELAIRLPRSQSASERLCRQHRWLPSLAPALPLAVPVPVRIGAPSVLFPWHWTVMRWVPGSVASQLPCDDKSVDVLAAFLRALHVESHIEAPVGDRLPDAPRVPRWIHGDLGPHTVVLAGGMPAGVVGWGEMCEGDPAVDLAAVCRALPSPAAARLLAAYDADEPTIERVSRWVGRRGE